MGQEQWCPSIHHLVMYVILPGMCVIGDTYQQLKTICRMVIDNLIVPHTSELSGGIFLIYVYIIHMSIAHMCTPPRMDNMRVI